MESKALKLIAGIALLVILYSLVSFRKDSAPTSPATTELPRGEASLDGAGENDQAEGERVARSFITAYNSYRYGDFSNITSLYGTMCADLETAEKAKIETLRQQFADFTGYVTVESQVKGSEIRSYDENKIVVRVSIEKITWNGALLPNGKEAGTFKLVDKSGQPYAGDKYELKEKTAQEIYEVTGIKEMSAWKICGFEKINQTK